MSMSKDLFVKIKVLEQIIFIKTIKYINDKILLKWVPVSVEVDNKCASILLFDTYY